MASLRVIAFDHDGRPVQFDTWLDDLQLYLLSDSKDSESLFDLVSGAATTPPATADSATRSQWLTRNAAARLAIRNHLPLAECAHFGQHRTAQALNEADLVSHLRTSNVRYRATVPAEFLDRNQPPMFITLYFIVTHLSAPFRSIRDHFLSLDPTSLTVDLLEQHLLAAETSAVAVGAARGTPRPPFFEGCSPSPLAPSYASAAAADNSVAEDVGAASASAKRRNNKGKGGRGGGGGSSGGGGGSGSGGGGNSGGSGGSGGGGGGGSGGSGGSGGGRTGPRHGGPGGGHQQQHQRRSETQSPQQLREWLFQRGTSWGSDSCPYVIRTGFCAGQTCGKLHSQHCCFSRLNDAWRAEFGDDVELPCWADLHRSRVAIFDLDFDVILSSMYALSGSAEGDCYQCVPPDPGIAATTLGASESGPLPGTAPAQALHTFTLDSGASRCFFRDSTTLTPLPELVTVRLADPSGGPVIARSSTVLLCPAVPFGSLSGLHLPSFSTNLVAASAQVSASCQVAASCSCRLLLHKTLRWHHRLGHPSLPRLCGMHSRLLVCGLPRSLTPLPPSPAPPCLPCVKGRQRAAPQSSSFPPTSAPLQTLHMDVWGPARVSGQGRERYFLLVVDDYMRYTTVFPLRSKGEVVDVLIPCIRTVRLQLRERFGHNLPVLRLHSDRGGEFSSTLLRDFFRGEGILQSFTLPDSPQQNGIAERRIGLVREVARTSMIHAATPNFLWLFAVRYAAHQLNLWPRVSLPETSPTLRWTGEVGDALVFRVWGSRAFVRDMSADKLSARAIPCVFLGFVPDAPGWQFYQPTLPRILTSQDVTFDESVPFYRLFPYRSAPPLPPPLFLAPGPPPVDPLPPQGPAPSGVSQVDPLPGTAPLVVAVGTGVGSRVAEPRAEEPRGAEPAGVEPGGADPEGVEPGGAESEGAESGGAEPWGAALSGGRAGASARLSPSQLSEWLVWHARLWSGATRAGDASASGAGVTARAAGTRGGAATGPGGARARGAGAAGTGGTGGARARGAGVGGPGAGGAGATGAGAVDRGAGGARGTVRPRPYFVPLLKHVLGVPSSPSLTPPLLCPPPYLSQLPLLSASPLPAPSPYTEQSSSLIECREPASCRVSPVRTACRVPRLCPPRAPNTHAMALRTSSIPLRVPLPALPEVPDPESDRARAASPTISRLLATAVTDPSFESAAAFALVAELLDFAGACRLDYATALVAESAPASPPSVGGECDLGMDVLEDRVKQPPGSPPAFKARYVARGFSQQQGVDNFHTFSLTPQMTTLWVLLHPARGDLAAPPTWLHWVVSLRTTLAALGFALSTNDPSLFLRTDTSLPPFYVLVYVDNLVFATTDTEALTLVKSGLQKRHTFTDLGELRSYLGLQITQDRARRTITLTQSYMAHQVLQRFGFQFSSPQPTPLSTSHSLSAPPSDESVEPSGPYPELVGCLMYLMTCTRPDLAYPLSLLARYVVPGRHRKVHWDAAKRVLRYLCSTSGMGLVLGGRGPVVLTGHADASWVDDSATQRSSQGYTFSLGSGYVSWRSTRSSSVLSSSEVEIYAGAMAAQELRWLTYLLTDLGEQPRSPPVLYVDNKAIIALCEEH
ncbi:unnamed protein product [Closterium sp. NIES-53]